MQAPQNTRRRALPAILLAAVLAGVLGLATSASAAPANDPARARAALEEGLRLAQQPGSADQAVKKLKRADRLTPGGSFAARLALARCYSRLGRLDDQVDAAREALAVAKGAPERVAARRELALGLAGRAHGEPGRNGRKDLEAADDVFHEALEEAGSHAPPVLLYEQAVVLLRLGRDDEGLPLLRSFLAAAPEGELTAKARDLLERPERARLSLLPSFELTTLDGEPISDESLEGSVVVLDFWATWCAPCHDSLPTLAALHRLGQKSGRLTVVSISPETAKTVKGFVGKHRMVWTQVAGESGEEAMKTFGVHSLPTIIVADAEGLVVSRSSGWAREWADPLVAAARKAVERARQADGDLHRTP